MNKILKNTTNFSVFVGDTGISIPANSSYDITESELLLWVSSSDILSLISNGTIVVNNGSSDLSSNDGIRFLQYPDRLTVKVNDNDTVNVTTDLNFTGNVTVTDNGDGKATINVGTGASTPDPILREVTAVHYPFGLVNITSDLLFEADPVNDVIRFLKEEI